MERERDRELAVEITLKVIRASAGNLLKTYVKPVGGESIKATLGWGRWKIFHRSPPPTPLLSIQLFTKLFFADGAKFLLRERES